MEMASYNPVEYLRARSSSPVTDQTFYDLSYMDFDSKSLDMEIKKDKKKHNFKTLHLILSNNMLTEIPLSLQTFRDLETLDLSSNHLKSLSFNIKGLRNLKKFIAKDNLLSDNSLPKDFNNNKLQVINLSGNKFTQFPFQLLELQTIREIYMGSNEINVLPRNYENLQKLEILYLGGNMIKHVPEEISQLKSLTSLNLSGNLLKILPSRLALLKKLRTLSLHGNELTTLPVELVKLSLRELSLRNNPLVNKFAKEFTYEVPSLLELGARCIKTNHVNYEKGDLPTHLKKYLESAHCCLNPKCRGVYFDSKVEHVKFVDFCGRFRIPLMQYLCSSTCNEKITNYSKNRLDSSSDSDDNSTENDKLLKKILLG